MRDLNVDGAAPRNPRGRYAGTPAARCRSPRRTESGDGPVWQGATREQIGYLRPRSNVVQVGLSAARMQRASAAGCQPHSAAAGRACRAPGLLLQRRPSGLRGKAEALPHGCRHNRTAVEGRRRRRAAPASVQCWQWPSRSTEHRDECVGDRVELLVGNHQGWQQPDHCWSGRQRKHAVLHQLGEIRLRLVLELDADHQPDLA